MFYSLWDEGCRTVRSYLGDLLTMSSTSGDQPLLSLPLELERLSLDQPHSESASVMTCSLGLRSMVGTLQAQAVRSFRCLIV
jgi:hypothetical protein